MQRQMENKSLKEDLESNSRQNIQDKKEYEKLIAEMEKLKASFFCIVNYSIIVFSLKNPHRILAVVKVETDIIASITASLIG